MSSDICINLRHEGGYIGVQRIRHSTCVYFPSFPHISLWNNPIYKYTDIVENLDDELYKDNDRYAFDQSMVSSIGHLWCLSFFFSSSFACFHFNVQPVNKNYVFTWIIRDNVSEDQDIQILCCEWFHHVTAYHAFHRHAYKFGWGYMTLSIVNLHPTPSMCRKRAITRRYLISVGRFSNRVTRESSLSDIAFFWSIPAISYERGTLDLDHCSLIQ